MRMGLKQEMGKGFTIRVFYLIKSTKLFNVYTSYRFHENI